MNIEVNGISTNYSVCGEGPDIVVLQGWGTSVELYADMCSHLSKNHRVSVLDMPGAGSTAEPPSSMCVDDYVDFVLEFLSKTGISEVALIGHSNGGRIAIKLSTRKACRLKINKMVLMGSAGIVHEKTAQQKRKARMYKIGKQVLSSKPMKTFFPDALENYKKSHGSADYRSATPIMRETLVRLVNEDLRDYLPLIKQPTLLIWGENDTATPLADGELMEKLIPDSGLVTVKGAGHYAYLEQPDFVYRVLDSFFGVKS